MGLEAIKLELIAWLTKLEDQDTIEYLKVVKDSKDVKTDGWDDLTDEQRKGIERGLQDIDAGRVTYHEDIRRKYGI